MRSGTQATQKTICVVFDLNCAQSAKNFIVVHVLQSFLAKICVERQNEWSNLSGKSCTRFSNGVKLFTQPKLATASADNRYCGLFVWEPREHRTVPMLGSTTSVRMKKEYSSQLGQIVRKAKKNKGKGETIRTTYLTFYRIAVRKAVTSNLGKNKVQKFQKAMRCMSCMSLSCKWVLDHFSHL